MTRETRKLFHETVLLFSLSSSRFAVVVPQDATKSLAALDLIGGASDFPSQVDESVVERLVIALCVVMGQESDHGGMRTASVPICSSVTRNASENFALRSMRRYFFLRRNPSSASLE
jgi:hypothetical protein